MAFARIDWQRRVRHGLVREGIWRSTHTDENRRNATVYCRGRWWHLSALCSRQARKRGKIVEEEAQRTIPHLLNDIEVIMAHG